MATALAHKFDQHNELAPLGQLNYNEYFVRTPAAKLCVREYGDPEGIPVLLIIGLGCQLVHWPDYFLEQLATDSSLVHSSKKQGIRLICFDNRDSGLSDHMRSDIKVDTRMAFVSYKLGITPNANYTLHDMANDTHHLINALGLDSVHVVGASMGGMIAQILAANHPEQVDSLSIVMSSTNSHKLPPPNFSLLIQFGLAGQEPKNKEAQIKQWLHFWKLVQSPKYPTPMSVIEQIVEQGFDRKYSPAGTLRQLHAILATGCLNELISTIETPTQIIHGTADPLLKPICAQTIQQHIPHAQLHMIKGLGHDFPLGLSAKLCGLIHTHIMKRDD